MNYRHSYHAGNVCDVVKHTILISVLDTFFSKKKPFGVLDTHAGTGLYYLEGTEAAKTYEYEQGVKQLWGTTPKNKLLEHYIKIISAFNSDGILKYYPGSPLIIDRFLRDTDQLICAELHPEDGKSLKNTLKHQKQVSVHLQDGYLTPNALLPFSQNRGVVFIDPPFETTDEFSNMCAAVTSGLKKMPQATFLLWYPIKEISDLNPFYSQLRKLTEAKILKSELYFYRQPEKNKLNGSGTVIINPPWEIKETLETGLSDLSKILAFEKGAPLIIESI